MVMADVLKFTRSQEFTVSIPSNSWVAAADKTYWSFTVSNPAINPFSQIEIAPQQSTTVHHLHVIRNAQLVAGSQANGSFVISALGVKPAQNITLHIIVRGGLV